MNKFSVLHSIQFIFQSKKPSQRLRMLAYGAFTLLFLTSCGGGSSKSAQEDTSSQWGTMVWDQDNWD